MKKPVLYSIVAVVVLGAAVGGVVLKRRAATNTNNSDKEARASLTVKTTQIKSSVVPISIKASGNISAWQDISISSQNKGLRLVELRANVGDTVRKGQVLAVFDTSTINAEVLQARANLAAAQAKAAEARSTAARARSIAGTGALSKQQISQMQTAAKASAAQVQAARAVLRIQRTRQGYTRIIAPDDGVISSRKGTVGAIIPPGMEMFRMVRQGKLEWQAEISAKDLGRVQTGQTATLKNNLGKSVEGTVRSVSPTLDKVKRVGIAYIDLPDAHEQGFVVGMYADGQINLGETEGLAVLHSAVVKRDGFNYLFVLQDKNTVQQRQVELGASNADMVQIVKGVNAGETVVSAGAGFLNDGDVVRVQNSAAIKATTPKPTPAAAKPNGS